MKKFLLLLLLSYSLLFAQSSVWKVQKNDETIYIGGTIHLLREQDYPLPKTYQTSFQKADKIFFETTLRHDNPQAFQNKFIRSMQVNKAKSLSKVLSKTTYQRLSDTGLRYGLSINQFENFKPMMMLLTITIAEFQQQGFKSQGVDAYYENMARRDRKPTGILESVDEQLSFLSGMGKGNQDNFVWLYLNDLEKTKTNLSAIVQSWRTGDKKRLDELLLIEMKRDFPKVYQSLLVQRNHNWMPKIKAMFNEPGIEFILVGTAHLIGDDGILTLLQNEGYYVEQLK